MQLAAQLSRFPMLENSFNVRRSLSYCTVAERPRIEAPMTSYSFVIRILVEAPTRNRKVTNYSGYSLDQLSHNPLENCAVQFFEYILSTKYPHTLELRLQLEAIAGSFSC